MKPDRWQQVEKIYHGALERDENQRAAFLEEACRGDDKLRQEVESLLQQNGRAEAFLQEPALEVAAQELARDEANSMVGRQTGSYRILSLLGTGGMGEVYLARDATLGRKVALKFLPDFLRQDDSARKRFLREAKLAAALDHPFICKVYEIGEEDQEAFISLEYVQGKTLQEKLAAGPADLQETWQIAAEIAEALAEAHRRGIVHRDLKPANVMFTADGHVKVMDFGLAKQLIHSEDQEQSITGMTKTGTTLGTLPYMSPEQVRGQKVDTRSDLFSFGVVLYEMLTGKHPFRRSVAADTAVAILGNQPVSVNQLRPEVGEELESVVAKLLAKDPDQRYQTASELGKELKESRDKKDMDLGGLLKALSQTLSRPRILFPLVLAALAAIIPGYWYYSHRVQIRWAREEAIPRIERLIEQDQFVDAFHLAGQAEQYLPEDRARATVAANLSSAVSRHPTVRCGCPT